MSIKLSPSVIRTLALVLTTASFAACANVEDGIDSEEGDVSVAPADKADRPSVPFTIVTDNAIGNQPAARVLIKTASAYRSYFGHAAPSAINFSTDWVVFYSAGTKNTGGYAAAIDNVTTSASGVSLKVTTSLSSPGPDCFVTQSLTNPKVLVKFAKQRTTGTLFYKNDSTRSCNTPTCATVRCSAGNHCEVKVVECLVAPCPVLAQCVPDAPACPPNTKLCIRGYHYDNTPGVCDCVPYPACGPNTKLCMLGSHYDNTPGVCDCVPYPACGPNTKLCVRGSHYDNTPGVCDCVPYPACPPNTKACMTDSHYDGTPGVCDCVPNVGACNSDADCTLADDYCTGCDCRALGPGQSLPICTGPGVRCLRQPCGGLTASCQNHRCTSAPATM